MGIEIERKFLVREPDLLPPLENGEKIVQCYLPRDTWLNYWPGDNNELVDVLSDALSTYRFRVKGDKAEATAKNKSDGPKRLEFERSIPVQSVLDLVASGKYPCITKMRYVIPTDDGLFWEVDLFEGKNSGLIIGEIEIPHQNHPISIPKWVSKELTGQDEIWSNYALSINPYSNMVGG